MVTVNQNPKFSKEETIFILLEFPTHKDSYLKPSNTGFNVFLCVHIIFSFYTIRHVPLHILVKSKFKTAISIHSKQNIFQCIYPSFEPSLYLQYRKGVGRKPVQITKAQLCYKFFVYFTSIIICRLYKLTLSD